MNADGRRWGWWVRFVSRPRWSLVPRHGSLARGVRAFAPPRRAPRVWWVRFVARPDRVRAIPTHPCPLPPGERELRVPWGGWVRFGGALRRSFGRGGPFGVGGGPSMRGSGRGRGRTRSAGG